MSKHVTTEINDLSLFYDANKAFRIHSGINSAKNTTVKSWVGSLFSALTNKNESKLWWLNMQFVKDTITKYAFVGLQQAIFPRLHEFI